MPIEPSAEWTSKSAGLGETLGRAVSPQYYKGRDTIDARLAESSGAMNAVAAKRGAGVPVTDADRAKAQQGWEDNRLWGKINDAYEKNYNDWAGKWFHPKGDDYGNVVRRSFGEARDTLGREFGTIKPDPRQLGAQSADRDLYNREAKLGDYGSTKQAAEGTVPSAEASMPAHEEAHDTHGNEVNPFEKVVKAYNAYKAKKGFKDETPTVEPNVTGNLPPAPGNLVHEWYAKEHGMERQASVMEKQAISWNGAKYWAGKWLGKVGDVYGKVADGKWEDVPDAIWEATPIAVGLEAAEKQVTDFNRRQAGHAVKAGVEELQSPEVQKQLDAQSSRAGRNMANGAMDAMWDRGKELWNEYGKGNHIGNFFGMGGENWKWLAGALGLGALGYGAYRMFSGGGGSGGGWGGGAANSSAYYRNRHGYNHPDYEGMMVDNMMARRGGYGY